ncbi:MAG TPA: BTAD domain-containing putative transcriptional regulator [Streptosporangiaceae bacterium]|nr:BTAD domain-containing putative transcriptional regulator [Streptosporangiaceae bacterium]
MQFRILGPLEVRTPEGWRGIGAPKWRALLGALLLRPGQVVPTECLVDELWGDDAPTRARKLASGYVLQLRRLIDDPDGRMLVTRSGGYQLLAAHCDLDAGQFEGLVTAGRKALAQDDAPRAAGRLAEALALWRGPALADVPPGPLVSAESNRLEELRRTALELRIEADRTCGRDTELVAELRRLTTEHPLRERLWGELMRALHSSGRSAEALEVYAHAQQVIADQLGADLASDLQQLHQHILTGDQAWDGRPAAARADPPEGREPPPASHGRQDVPRQLPAGVRHFVGRKEEMERLSGLLDETSGASGAVVISAIGGTAGIGKTALAVHWAHQNAERFPDGQLYVNLRGFDPSGTPMPVTTAVRGFLGALAVPPASVPDDLDAQVALYRSLLAGLRILIVLDNALDAAQVRPLLPGTASCSVLVTSRNQLAGLVAADGATPLTLDLLSPDEARELLSRRLGRERVAREEQAAGELAELCARLPLALNIAAARAVLRPGWPLAALVSELRGTRQRLNPLTTGDSAADLRAVLSWSCHTLSTGAARMFRLLGLHPGPDISVPAAVSLAALDRDQVRRALDELTAAHLLTEHTPGRYTFHDLLRAFAAEQAHLHDTKAERFHARHRALDHYLRTGHAAFSVLYPGWIPLDPPPPVPGVVPEHLTDAEQALAWYEAEHTVLVTVTSWAAEEGFDSYAWQIPCALGTIMERRAHWQEWATVSEVALGAAQRSRDLAGQAHSHHRLGQALLARGSYQAARTHLQQALALFDRLGDLARQGDVYVALSTTLSEEKRFADAVTCAERAIALYRATSHVAGQSIALNNLGWFEDQLGRYDQALVYCRQALDLSREAGEHECEALTLDSIGHAHHRLSHHAEAISSYEQALQLEQAIGDHYNYARTLVCLGDVHHDGGDRDAARDAWRQALVILDELHHPDARQVHGKLLTLESARQRPAHKTVRRAR